MQIIASIKKKDSDDRCIFALFLVFEYEGKLLLE
jgi:hypothetical protein